MNILASQTSSLVVHARRAAFAAILLQGFSLAGCVASAGTEDVSAAEEPMIVSNARRYAPIATGPRHTCVVTATGGVKCFGINSEGQLGDGTLTTRSTPVAATGVSGAFAVAAGETHSCALLAGGRVMCWGENGFGQSGVATSSSPIVTPSLVAGVVGAVQITAGQYHSCALLSGGSAACWGRLPQAGGTAMIAPGVYRVASPSGAQYTSIAAGTAHTCASRVDGAVDCWGDNHAWQFGRSGLSLENSDKPIQVDSPETKVSGATSVFAGGNLTCATLVSGGAKCWGNTVMGYVANYTGSEVSGGAAAYVPWMLSARGDVMPFSTASTPPPPQASGATAIATSMSHQCIVKPSGAVACWGSNSDGQLGVGPIGSAQFTPVVIPGLTAAASASLSLGANHTCVKKLGDTLRCFGAGSRGQLGDGNLVDNAWPVSPVPGFPVTAIAAGGEHTCLLGVQGNVACSGANAEGQLGFGAPGVDATYPKGVLNLGATAPAIAITAGAEHSCALKPNGHVVCWGGNGGGQLGTGDTSPRFAPLDLGILDAVAVSAGDAHTCALHASGAISCWGANEALQTGIDAGPVIKAPTIVADVPPAIAIAAGGDFTCAITAAGALYCWGGNTMGQLAREADKQPGLPMQSLSDVVAVSAGKQFACALRASGDAMCWGSNSMAQLGRAYVGDFDATPSKIIDLGAGVTAIEAGGEHACALRSSNDVYCWGRGFEGQIGNGVLDVAKTAVHVGL